MPWPLHVVGMREEGLLHHPSAVYRGRRALASLDPFRKAKYAVVDSPGSKRGKQSALVNIIGQHLQKLDLQLQI